VEDHRGRKEKAGNETHVEPQSAHEGYRRNVLPGSRIGGTVATGGGVRRFRVNMNRSVREMTLFSVAERTRATYEDAKG
jgi:hypothetical protein